MARYEIVIEDADDEKNGILIGLQGPTDSDGKALSEKVARAVMKAMPLVIAGVGLKNAEAIKQVKRTLH